MKYINIICHQAIFVTVAEGLWQRGLEYHSSVFRESTKVFFLLLNFLSACLYHRWLDPDSQVRVDWLAE